eukprot:131357-Pelagomonas_calceolata.AAC.1
MDIMLTGEDSWSDQSQADQPNSLAEVRSQCAGDVCALRRKYAYLFNCFSGDSSMEQPFLLQASV